MSTNINDLANKQNKERQAEHEARLIRNKKRKVVVAFSVITVIMLIPVFLYIGYKAEKLNDRIIKKADEKQDEPFDYPTGGLIIPDEVLEAETPEALKGDPSDIIGMDKYDKYKNGLFVYDGSDTDYDGLTDKEEIEVYGSDPLKCSTAGDLYSDGYKVAHGLSVDEYIDYDGETTTSDADGIITIYAKTPFDVAEPGLGGESVVNTSGMQIADYTDTALFNAGIDVYGFEKPLSENVYRAYIITGYDGDEITVDLDAAANLLNVESKSLDVEVYGQSNTAKYSIKKKDGRAEIKIKDKEVKEGTAFGHEHIVYIIEKDKFSLFNMTEQKEPMANNTQDPTLYTRDNGFITVCPPMTCFLNIPVKIYCTKDATDYEKDALVKQAAKIHGKVFYKPLDIPRPVYTRDNITYVSKARIKRLDKICSFLFGEKCRMDIEGRCDFDDKVELMCYESLGDFYEDALREEALAQAKKEEAAAEQEARDAKFNVKDEFAFANFTSAYTNQGVCLGFAKVAAEVYNNGHILNEAGEYKGGEFALGGIDYDIKNGTTPVSAEEVKKGTYDTFYDRYLNDFDYPVPDDEVIKMLSCYWANANKKVNKDYDITDFYLSEEKHKYLSWDTVENATKYLDNHKALIAGFFLGNTPDGAHAVNLVGYKRVKLNELHDNNQTLKINELVVFDVYDSNRPQKIESLYCYKYTTISGKPLLLYTYGDGEYQSRFLSNSADNLPLKSKQEHGIAFFIMNEDLELLNVKP